MGRKEGEFFVRRGEYLRPTRKFYEQNQRSWQLRNILVAITLSLARLVFDETFRTSPEEKSILHQHLQQQGQELVEMGIKVGMKTGKRQSFYNDPVNMAEYVAGQLLPYTGIKARSQSTTKPIIQEFNQDGGIILNKQLPEGLTEFWVDGWIVGNAIDFLDAEEEVKAGTSLTLKK